MTTRTREKFVTFRKSFVLGGFDGVLPAGDYRVETDEEVLDTISTTAYRKKMTMLHLLAVPGRPGIKQALPIDSCELDAALLRDQVGVDHAGAPYGGSETTREFTAAGRRPSY